MFNALPTPIRRTLLAVPMAMMALLSVAPSVSAADENRPGRRVIDPASGLGHCYCSDFEENNCFCG